MKSLKFLGRSIILKQFQNVLLSLQINLFLFFNKSFKNEKNEIGSAGIRTWEPEQCLIFRPTPYPLGHNHRRLKGNSQMLYLKGEGHPFCGM